MYLRRCSSTLARLWPNRAEDFYILLLLLLLLLLVLLLFAREKREIQFNLIQFNTMKSRARRKKEEDENERTQWQ